MSTQTDPRTATSRPSAPGAVRTEGAGAGRPNAVRGTLLVAEREVMAQLRSKSFLISTAVLLAVVVGSIVAGSIFAGRDTGPTELAVVAATEDALADLRDSYEGVLVDDEAAAREAVLEGEVPAAIVPGEGPTGLRVLVAESPPSGLVESLAIAPDVEVLEEPVAGEGLRYLVAFGFGLVFLMSATGFGSTIAQNTVQEKQSRVVELLLATVSARTLLAGKILGNSALAFAQTAAIVAAAVLGLVVTGQDDVLGLVGAPFVWFVLFFVVGFVLLAAIFAASASLVSRQEDVGAVLSPAMILTMTPYFLVVFFNDNSTVLRVMSFVPFSAPVGMPVRLFLNEAAWWEPLLSLGILAVSALVVIAIGAKIYERSLLRTGPRVRLRDVVSG